MALRALSFSQPAARRRSDASQLFANSFQRSLARRNRERLAPALPTDDRAATLERDDQMQRLGGGFLEALRAGITDKASEAPAPGRSARVAKGLCGTGLSEHRYFALHAALKVIHSGGCNREALKPAAAGDPACAAAIAEGAPVRLRCGLPCFERHRDHLWN